MRATRAHQTCVSEHISPAQLQPQATGTHAPSELWRCHPDPDKRTAVRSSLQAQRCAALSAWILIRFHRRELIYATWLSTDPGNMNPHNHTMILIPGTLGDTIQDRSSMNE